MKQRRNSAPRIDRETNGENESIGIHSNRKRMNQVPPRNRRRQKIFFSHQRIRRRTEPTRAPKKLMRFSETLRVLILAPWEKNKKVSPPLLLVTIPPTSPLETMPSVGPMNIRKLPPVTRRVDARVIEKEIGRFYKLFLSNFLFLFYFRGKRITYKWICNFGSNLRSSFICPQVSEHYTER